ncbi:MAG TPA: hypothetical protein VHE55_04715 [Fimbriimonadaceae bacterium]|nr:hypothetical protein [Fimbriimonadaceae bacterium]
MSEIGRVIGTEKRPNTAYTFYFWTAPGGKVGIGSLVKVVAGAETVYGVVVEAQGFNDLESPLHEFLSVGGEAGKEPPTNRPEMRVFQAAVLRREPEEPIGAVPIGRVFLADEADVQKALRFDAYADEHGIPAGCYGSKDEPVAVQLHAQFLLGPESGHLNMTGTSGLAAKTSFILFLLKSIFTHAKDAPGANGAKGVAALLFNTKGADLLYIDQEPQHPVDSKLYDACRVPATPFERVRYFAPFDKDGSNLMTLRRNSELEAINPTRPFSFGLKDVIKHAEVLLNRDDLDAKADAYLQYLNDRFVEGDGHPVGDGPKRKATSLRELISIIQDQLKMAEMKNATQIESHSALTARKMYNRINNLGGRFAGVIAENGLPTGPFDQEFEPNTVYVVDVAGLDSDSQDLVFAGFITTLRERMESGDLGVGRLVVMVDELNKYAPSGGTETYVVKSLREIAARGRYLGLTLFGAQQFRSRVDKEIVGNAATHVFGHVEAEELAQPGYSYFTPAVKEKLGALKPGEVLLKHPHFAQPVFLNFPVPACMKGQDGLRRYQQSKGLTLYELIVNEILRLRGDVNRAKDVLDGLSQNPKDMREVLRALRNARAGDDPIEVLRGGRKQPMRAEAKAVVDDHDPFADLV